MSPFASETWTNLENTLVKPQDMFFYVLVEIELDLYMQLESDMCLYIIWAGLSWEALTEYCIEKKGALWDSSLYSAAQQPNAKK